MKISVTDADLQMSKWAMIRSARENGRELDTHVDDLRAAIESFLDSRGILDRKSN